MERREGSYQQQAALRSLIQRIAQAREQHDQQCGQSNYHVKVILSGAERSQNTNLAVTNCPRQVDSQQTSPQLSIAGAFVDWATGAG